MKSGTFFPLYLSCTALALVVLPLYSQQLKPQTDPAFLEQFQRGAQALAAAKYSDAVNAFKKANKLQNNSCTDCYLGMAVACFHMGESEKVLENSDKALSVASDDAQRAVAHNLKGVVFTAYGESDSRKLGAAEAEFRSATGLAPGNPLFHMSLARTLLKQSKDEEAIQELRKCLALQPDQPTADQAKMLIVEPRRGRENFAPGFHFTSMQGQDISLPQLAGKIVVLDFWATWCPPCRASVPELKELTKKYRSDSLVLISISVDKDEQAWRDFVAKKGMDWLQFRDSDHKILDAFSVKAFPTYLVIDEEGIIRHRLVGMNPQETFVHRLKAILASLPSLQGDKKD